MRGEALDGEQDKTTVLQREKVAEPDGKHVKGNTGVCMTQAVVPPPRDNHVGRRKSHFWADSGRRKRTATTETAMLNALSNLSLQLA